MVQNRFLTQIATPCERIRTIFVRLNPYERFWSAYGTILQPNTVRDICSILLVRVCMQKENFRRVHLESATPAGLLNLSRTWKPHTRAATSPPKHTAEYRMASGIENKRNEAVAAVATAWRPSDHEKRRNCERSRLGQLSERLLFYVVLIGCYRRCLMLLRHCFPSFHTNVACVVHRDVLEQAQESLRSLVRILRVEVLKARNPLE